MVPDHSVHPLVTTLSWPRGKRLTSLSRRGCCLSNTDAGDCRGQFRSDSSLHGRLFVPGPRHRSPRSRRRPCRAVQPVDAHALIVVGAGGARVVTGVDRRRCCRPPVEGRGCGPWMSVMAVGGQALNPGVVGGDVRWPRRCGSPRRGISAGTGRPGRGRWVPGSSRRGPPITPISSTAPGGGARVSGTPGSCCCWCRWKAHRRFQP